MSTSSALVQKLWNYPPSHGYGLTGCNSAQRDDDGLSFRLRVATTRQNGDYVEQLTFLLFLKMANGWTAFV